MSRITFRFIVSSVSMANALHENRLIWGMSNESDISFSSDGSSIRIEGCEGKFIAVGLFINQRDIKGDGCVSVGSLIKLHRILKAIPEQPVSLVFDRDKDITITCQL